MFGLYTEGEQSRSEQRTVNISAIPCTCSRRHRSRGQVHRVQENRRRYTAKKLSDSISPVDSQSSHDTFRACTHTDIDIYIYTCCLFNPRQSTNQLPGQGTRRAERNFQRCGLLSAEQKNNANAITKPQLLIIARYSSSPCTNKSFTEIVLY